MSIPVELGKLPYAIPLYTKHGTFVCMALLCDPLDVTPALTAIRSLRAPALPAGRIFGPGNAGAALRAHLNGRGRVPHTPPSQTKV